MNKIIILSLLITLAFAKLEDTPIIGGWKDYPITTGLQSDPTHPLTKIFGKLGLELSKQKISDIKFISAQSQLVNGLNFKINFSYVLNEIQKNGQLSAYISFNGKHCEIHEIKLQRSLRSNFGGWKNYTIPVGFEADPSEPLNMVMIELDSQLTDLSASFIKFAEVQYQLVAGQKFQIKFLFLNNVGQIDIGTCFAYVRSWENFVEISELSVKAPETVSENEEKHSEGGWSSYNYTLSELQQNSSTDFGSAYSNLYTTLKNDNIEIVSISNVQQQVVSGVNYKLSFIYSEGGYLKIGHATIYVQSWTHTIKITELELTGQIIHY